MLRLFLFFPVLVLAQELFLLPDDAEILMSSYLKKVQQTRSKLYLYTPYLNDRDLVKSIKQLAKKEVKTIIISQKPLAPDNKITHLALFENIHVYTLKNSKERNMQGSFICIDDQEYFLIDDQLDQNRLKEGYSISLFQVGPCKTLFSTLLRRSDAY